MAFKCDDNGQFRQLGLSAFRRQSYCYLLFKFVLFLKSGFILSYTVIDPSNELSTVEVLDGHADFDIDLNCLKSCYLAPDRSYIKLKRIFDFCASALSLVLLAPIFLLFAVLIRLDSKGPALFTQKRWGQNGEVIEIYKFRSMRIDMCDVRGVKQTEADDPRITKIGRFIRKYNIDELPQLLNVLRGDMSIVGPRCHPVGMLAAGVTYEELVPDYHSRHLVPPGITGLAQIRGLRGPTVRPSKARARITMDLYYVQHASLGFDIKIIYLTIKNELFNSSGF